MSARCASTVTSRPSPQPREPDRAQATTTRRAFLGIGVSATLAAPAIAAAGEHAPTLREDRMGVLVDLTECVGCRRCEWACCDANGLPHGPLHEYDDQTVFEDRRYPSPNQLTVVNRAKSDPTERDPVHLKVQCMHCDKPACVSACLVGAMQKDPDGPVHYDASRCIGCRYCMVACPFEILSYEYERSLAPRVRKCELCRDRTRDGKLPACVEMCPVEALTYGRRSELLALAHDRIAKHPDRYTDHVYGEHEAGGTSWLYIAGRDFASLGLPTVGPKSPAALSEAIQHGIFRGFAVPIVIAGLLGAVNHLTKEDHK